MPTLDQIVIGSNISFRSKAVNDNNAYLGKVIGMVTADIAKTHADVYTYNTSIQSADINVPAVELLTFLLIKLTEAVDGTTRYIIPFALDWINIATLNIISSDRVAIIRVFDVDSTNSQDVINLLKSAGFKARVDSLT